MIAWQKNRAGKKKELQTTSKVKQFHCWLKSLHRPEDQLALDSRDLSGFDCFFKTQIMLMECGYTECEAEMN